MDGQVGALLQMTYNFFGGLWTIATSPNWLVTKLIFPITVLHFDLLMLKQKKTCFLFHFVKKEKINLVKGGNSSKITMAIKKLTFCIQHSLTQLYFNICNVFLMFIGLIMFFNFTIIANSLSFFLAHAQVNILIFY